MSKNSSKLIKITLKEGNYSETLFTKEEVEYIGAPLTSVGNLEYHLKNREFLNLSTLGRNTLIRTSSITTISVVDVTDDFF